MEVNTWKAGSPALGADALWMQGIGCLLIQPSAPMSGGPFTFAEGWRNLTLFPGGQRSRSSVVSEAALARDAVVSLHRMDRLYDGR